MLLLKNLAKNCQNLYKINQFLLINVRCNSINASKSEVFTYLAKNVTDNAEIPSATKDKTEAQQRSLQVAVIGVPNAGKSTFINNLINHRVREKKC